MNILILHVNIFYLKVHFFSYFESSETIFMSPLKAMWTIGTMPTVLNDKLASGIRILVNLEYMGKNIIVNFLHGKDFHCNHH